MGLKHFSRKTRERLRDLLMGIQRTLQPILCTICMGERKQEEEAIQRWCADVRVLVCRDCRKQVRNEDLSSSQQSRSGNKKRCPECAQEQAAWLALSGR